MVKSFHKNLRIRTFAMVMLLNFLVILLISIFFQQRSLSFLSGSLLRRSTSKPRLTGSVLMPGGSRFTRSQSTRRLTQAAGADAGGCGDKQRRGRRAPA